MVTFGYFWLLLVTLHIRKFNYLCSTNNCPTVGIAYIMMWGDAVRFRPFFVQNRSANSLKREN